MNFAFAGVSALGLIATTIFSATFALDRSQQASADNILEDAERAVEGAFHNANGLRFANEGAIVFVRSGLVCGGYVDVDLPGARRTTFEYNFSEELGPGFRNRRPEPWQANSARCSDLLTRQGDRPAAHRAL